MDIVDAGKTSPLYKLHIDNYEVCTSAHTTKYKYTHIHMHYIILFETYVFELFHCHHSLNCIICCKQIFICYSEMMRTGNVRYSLNVIII